MSLMSQEALIAHHQKFPQLKCTNPDCKEPPYGGFQKDDGTVCPLCAYRDQQGHMTGSEGLRQAMPMEELYPNWDERKAVGGLEDHYGISMMEEQLGAREIAADRIALGRTETHRLGVEPMAVEPDDRDEADKDPLR